MCDDGDGGENGGGENVGDEGDAAGVVTAEEAAADVSILRASCLLLMLLSPA